jgi:hypothetical protein
MRLANSSADAFAIRLARVIEASALSVRDIGKRAKVAHTTITDWKSGKSLPQSFDDMIRVVRICVAAADAREAVLTSKEREESAWRAAWEDAKNARYRKGQPLPDGLSEQVNIRALELLTNFEIYLGNMTEGDYLDDLRALLDLVPSGIWPLIDGSAHALARSFMGERSLHRVGLSPLTTNSNMYDGLEFLLKIEWQRGYFLYKFHRFDLVPVPSRDIDSTEREAILEAVFASNPRRDIEVTLQRAVSLSSQPERARKCLRWINDGLAEALEEHLDDWCNTLRRVTGLGILAAKAEVALLTSTSS